MMVEIVDSPTLAGTPAGDCLVEAIVKIAGCGEVRTASIETARHDHHPILLYRFFVNSISVLLVLCVFL
jgi:hypothetical protein